MGQLMISSRDREDKSWNYLRPLPKVKSYLKFDPMGDGLYEAIVLDGLPTKVMSNSDSPPNSYRTRDTFAPHPTIPDAWKHVGRLDDRLTLVNGEKVLPIPMENRIRQDEYVHECLIFGIGRAFPGLLVIPSQRATGLTKVEILDRIMPSIDTTNSNAEKFAQISREMIEILEPGAEYPQTDKGTIIRAAAYKRFEQLIDSVYVRFETPSDATTSRRRKLDLRGIETYLLDMLQNRLDVKDLNSHTDFFSAGMDSLQAIVARGHIMRQIDLGGHVLGQNVIFEHPSIENMAGYLHSLSNGSSLQEKNELDVMLELVVKYSDFEPFKRGTTVPNGDVVVRTFLALLKRLLLI
jgi:hypothetical protein